MPQPTVSDVHVNAPLTNISIAYAQSQDAFVATRLFPVVPSMKRSNSYFTYNQSDWQRDEAQVRADATESVGSGYDVSTSTFTTVTYAIHKDIGRQTAVNADAPLDMERDAAEWVTQRLYTQMEVQFASTFFTTSVWDTDSTPGTTWDDASSDPITDINTGIQTVLQNTGFKPNTLLCGYSVWRRLKDHPDIVDRYKYTSSQSVGEDMLARVLGLNRVMVSTAIRDSAVEDETASRGFINSGVDALLCYSAPRPSLLAPSAGYTFVWQPIGNYPFTIRRMEVPLRDAVRIEGQVSYVQTVVATALGYFFDNCVAS